ncbi:MAG: hypothetical protein HY077_09735 [Elusimicrobia bacterium]|nr:hypothetical protein [Elusimicrobiota bacterium]
MSISSHLTPEPERRLWIILDAMRQAVESADRKVAVLTLFAAAELVFFKPAEYAGLLGTLTLIALAAALPLGVLAFSPLSGAPNWLPFIEPDKGQHSIDDCLVAADDISKYTHSELIHRFDKYLGGGITATQYHEDIVGQIVVHARIAVRKQRLFKLASLLVGAAQLGLLAHLI